MFTVLRRLSGINRSEEGRKEERGGVGWVGVYLPKSNAPELLVLHHEGRAPTQPPQPGAQLPYAAGTLHLPLHEKSVCEETCIRACGKILPPQVKSGPLCKHIEEEEEEITSFQPLTIRKQRETRSLKRWHNIPEDDEVGAWQESHTAGSRKYHKSWFGSASSACRRAMVAAQGGVGVLR